MSAMSDVVIPGAMADSRVHNLQLEQVEIRDHRFICMARIVVQNDTLSRSGETFYLRDAFE
jgi:hypothetical protein